MSIDPISRFSDHSSDYQKYRPGYPEAIITYLEQNIGLNAKKNIADIGSGTGIFTELFLRKGYPVIAVEPNAEMRLQAEEHLGYFKQFKSVGTCAESTLIPTASVDLITVAQAFHWFDTQQVRSEFLRIAKPGAHVLLVWNILQNKTPFLKAYQQFKEGFSVSKPYRDKADQEQVAHFFDGAAITVQEIYHSRLLDFNALLGYFRSSSYAPLPGEVQYLDAERDLQIIFDRFEKNGKVKLEYDAKMFLGKIAL